MARDSQPTLNDIIE
jgi:hypothetical protein